VRQMKHILDVGEAAGLPVSVCGEMASEPLSAVLLIGLGYTRLSVAPPALSPIKWVIRTVPVAAARAAAEVALSAPTSKAVQRALYEGVRDHVDLRLLDPRGLLPGK